MKKIRIVFGKKVLFFYAIFGVLFIFSRAHPTFVDNFNIAVKNSFYMLSGFAEADSSVSIIEISDADIQKFGGWPLTREIYINVIRKLDSAKARIIGLEILLSQKTDSSKDFSRFISASPNVVLSSLVTDHDKYGNPFNKDSLILSEPITYFPKIKSGHLNYFEKPEILVPVKLNVRDINQEAFSIVMTKGQVNYQNSFLKPKLNISWRSFERISLTNFLNLGTSGLETFKNKIVLIGLNSRKYGTATDSFFDNPLPGVGLHAILINNLLTVSWINYKANTLILSLVILLTIFLIHFPIEIDHSLKWLIFVIVMWIIGFLLFEILSIEFSYFWIFLPPLGFSLTELVQITRTRLK